MVIRFARSDEYPDVLAHYKICNYGGGVDDANKVVIAFDAEIIGAVRICFEYGTKVLRGMQIKPGWQRKGTGSQMLQFLAGHLDMNDCYCLPYQHLRSFYASIGFKEISPLDAPVFLAERREKYLSSVNNQVIIMAIRK